MKNRGFEKVSGFNNVELPKRGTKGSSGYDIRVLNGATIVPGGSVMLNTGIKAYMKEDEYLAIHIRSSIGIKKGLELTNNTGIIDSDYYNNEDNEGHIKIALYNKSNYPVTIEDNERVAQGIFCKYLTVDGDDVKTDRKGGIGSTSNAEMMENGIIKRIIKKINS